MAEFDFGVINPNDGFHVVGLESLGDASIYVQAYGNGVLQNLSDSGDPYQAAELIKEWESATEEDFGAWNRLTDVLDAVARYFNLGGSFKELDGALILMRRVIHGGIDFGAWFYACSYWLDNGTRVHVFFHKTDPDRAIRWYEAYHVRSGGVAGGQFEETTRDQVYADSELEASDEE